MSALSKGPQNYPPFPHRLPQTDIKFLSLCNKNKKVSHPLEHFNDRREAMNLPNSEEKNCFY
jgi:hypothetical protein